MLDWSSDPRQANNFGNVSTSIISSAELAAHDWRSDMISMI